MSVRVGLDLLDQFSNTRVLSLFHNRMWQPRYSEVNVHLVLHWLLVTWLVTCVTADNGCRRSITFNSFFMKRTCFDLLGTGRFSSTLRGPWVAPDNGLLRSIMIWVWIWLVQLGTLKLLHNLSIRSLSNFWTQFFHPVMFQWDLWRKPRWHVYFLVNDFSSFHPNNFRNTISWECFVKNDSVRSCLIELQSFLQSKIDVDPM